jgi:aspartate kinase
MGGVTDGLIQMAKGIMPLPNEREMDMLLATGEQTTIALTAIALHVLGVPACSMTGAQAGIVTDSVHTKAKIKNITPKHVHQLLDEGTSSSLLVSKARRWKARSRRSVVAVLI